MRIDELFNPSSAFEIEWDPDSSEGAAYATAHDRQGREINISFIGQYPADTNENWSAVHVEFARGGQYSITGQGDPERVFATIVRTIGVYLNKYKPTFVIFSADEISRNKLYRAMVRRYSNSYGYEQTTNTQLPDELKDIAGNSDATFALRKLEQNTQF